MILELADVQLLVDMLRMNCPVDTGNLRDNGIGGVQIIPQGYLIQIGFPEAVGFLPPTDSYASYTEYRNKTSKGWVRKTVNAWSNSVLQRIESRYERSVDYDFTNGI